MSLTGPPEAGWRAGVYTGYAIDYAVDHLNRRDAAALSAAMPVNLFPVKAPAWPGFVIDLLPQGYGRAELLRHLSLPETAEASADWPLLLAGTGNPIGNLRVKEAHEWLRQRTKDDLHGFTMEEVAARGEHFSEYLAQNGLFVAGSSGVQGEWPKILLTCGPDGLLYLDHALPENSEGRRYLVKFGRGPNAALANILRMEAPYMRLAKHLGLRVHGELELRDQALFIPRFDCSVEGSRSDGGPLQRHAQESIASLCEISGFGNVPTHNAACRRLAQVATHPLTELIEYLRRDIANIALGNKDNHGRNTAIQRREDGHIALTPVFDFAPMYLHPDGIARRMRWEQDDNGSPRWASVIAQACAATGLPADPVIAAIREMAAPMRELTAAALQGGIPGEFVDHLRHGIDNVAGQLEKL